MNKISFINAGAGSGKTFFLTNKLAEDIVSRKYNADEVFITTFSKKAAEEIKLKARALLLERDQTEQAVRLQNAFMGTLHSIGHIALHRGAADQKILVQTGPFS